MAIIDVNWNPNRRELRVFGISAMVASLIVGLLLHYRKGLPAEWTIAIVVFGLAVLVCSMVLPRIAGIIYVAMVAVAFPIGMVVSFVLMAAFYYLILTPIGIVFRLMGRDLLGLRYERSGRSYWIERQKPKSLKRYFQQF